MRARCPAGSGPGFLALAALLLLAPTSAARAQDAVAQFYKGQTVTIVVGSSAGGGYDLYGRMIARFLGKHMPGNPTIAVRNMPGAAGNVAAAHVYSVAPKDGTVIGAIFMGTVVEPLFGGKARTTHDTSRFNYIGNANRDTYMCIVRGNAPVKNFAEAFEHELIMGGTAEGASTRDFAVMLKNLLGVKFRIVAGYAGSREINLAIERGEVQGGCGQTWSSVAATYPAWFRDGTVKVLAQEDAEGHPDLNRQGVPRTLDFAKTAEQRQILELVYSQSLFGRPYVVAPEVPLERVAALRTAFMATLHDPELVAEAEKIKLDIFAISGEELQARIGQLYATPAKIVDKARQALVFKP